MGIFGVALWRLALKMALIIHDNRKFVKRAFYGMMNTGLVAFVYLWHTSSTPFLVNY